MADAAPDPRSLAASLAPRLREVADGRLGEISWFRTDWQRGGAATGVAEWHVDDGVRPAVVKLPVNRRELLWLRRLQTDEATPDPVVPRLYASGDELGGYDLAWVVMERFPHGPLGLRWQDEHVERLAGAVARFHAATARFVVDAPPRIEPWEELVEGAIESVRTNHVADEPRWRVALKTLRGRISELVAEWRSRPVQAWLHGDAHFANAMCRSAADEGPVALIDLAEVHAGHWIEDAVYVERQLWARADILRAHRPVRAIAQARRELGLETEPDYARLASLRRTLLAGTAPRFIRSEGHPAHLAACLAHLERGLGELERPPARRNGD